MNKIKTTIAVMVLLTASVLLAAADTHERAYERYTQALGIQYGQISGTGLSYYRWSDGVGFQAALGALYAPQGAGWGSTILDYSIGTELQYTVYGEAYAKWLSGQLYVFTGLSHRGYIEEEYIDKPDEDFTIKQGPFTPVFTTGFGIGIEMILFENFSVPLEFGYAISWKPSGSSIQEQLKVELVNQAGFRYRF